MYDDNRALTGADDVARARLAREFPELSPQIVAAVADAYRRAERQELERSAVDRPAVRTAS
jgi:hypothetical protein